MIPHALDTLAEVACFLNDTILPGLPATLRGELRAAIKLLADAEAELNSLPALLPRECRELDELEIATARVLGASNATVPVPTAFPMSGDLRTQLTHLVERQRIATDRLAALQQRLREDPDAADCAALLARYFDTFARHAEARLAWQAVFPAPLDIAPAR